LNQKNERKYYLN